MTNGDYGSRLDRIERRLDRLDDRVGDVPVVRAEVNNLKSEVHDLGAEVGGLRRALYTAALSVAGGSMVFAFTVFQVLR